MENSYRRHDMSDAMWEILKPYTIGNKGTWGGNAKGYPSISEWRVLDFENGSTMERPAAGIW